ncbi:phage tail tape measure protein [Winogradskyella pulchriflava]|uniref:Phage tail tape measure protein n=1 Tax=Winogradskyella pulchriflava TaxID=1110688 RepID=A0ABV6QC83_9FLAO
MAKKITDETLKFNIVVNGDKAQAEYNKLERSNRKLATATSDLEAQARKLEKANKQNTEEYKKLQTEIDSNNKAITDNKTKMAALTKEIGINNLTMSQLGKEARKLSAILNNLDPQTEEWKQYSNQLAAVQNRQFELRKETRETAKAMGEQDAALTTLTSGFATLFSGMKSGNFADVKTGFADIKSGIGGATKAALAFIATPIGAAIAALAGIGLAAKSWFDYNSAVVEALRLTTQITGLTDQAADQARIRGEALAETFDVDFKETMETAATLAKQFDISFNEAFDSIENGLVRGQKNNDEFFDSLKEYPVLFDQAGFSAQEFANIVETGYDLKIYSDKLPDAIKEANLSLTEQTTATRDALVNAFGAPFTDSILKRVKQGEITTKEALAEISNQAETTGLNVQQNAQLTADLFRGAGEDAGGAIKVFEALDIALNNNQRELTESEQITQQQVKATTELKQVSSALFSTGDKGFGLLIDKAKLFGTKMLIDILKAGIDIYNWFVDLNNESRVFSGIITTIGTMSTYAFEIIGEGISLIKNQFGSLGDIISGIFTFDTDQIKKGMNGFISNIGDSFTKLKEKALEDQKEIADAFAGNNKLERKTLEDFTGPDAPTTPNQQPVSGNGNDNELTAEDQKVLDSRKKLYEQLKALQEEQELQEELNKLDKSVKAEEEEILRKEAEYAKLIEEAGKDQELKAGFEDALQFELQQIRDKYAEERLEKDKSEKKKLADQDKKFKEEQIKAEQELADAKSDAIHTGIGLLQSMLDESSGLAKALFLIDKAVAATDVFLKGQQERAAIAATYAALGPAGLAISKPLILASKLRTITSLASIAATTIQGFEEGLYPVTRAQDGKVFNATFGGAPTTQIVGTPKTFLAGEMPELIVDPQTFKKMDPQIVDYILELAGKRPSKPTPGYEKGQYPTTTTETPSTTTNNVVLSDETLLEFIDTMKNLKATVVYTLQDEQQRRALADKLDQTIAASKT